MFSFVLEIQQKPTLDYLKNGSVSTSFHTIPSGFEPAISPRQSSEEN